MNILERIRAKGLSISLSGDDGFKIDQKENLNKDRVDFLKKNKPEIMDWLFAEKFNLTGTAYRKIIDYLKSINEVDPDIIHETLDRCGRDNGVLDYFTSRA